jgi:hypothetical protein
LLLGCCYFVAFFVNLLSNFYKSLNMKPALFLGIIALFIGVSLRYWINRRKFYRRSPMGVEGFSSYEKSVVTTFL